VDDFPGLPSKLKSLLPDFNFYLQARRSRQQGYPEPAKLSSASVCARAFAVNPTAVRAPDSILRAVVISVGNKDEK